MINPTYYPQPNYYQQPVQQASNVLVSVRNQQEAMNYPVAPGNSVIFKDEGAPYIYTKTMGFSQLDKPIFEKYKLVKEDAPEEPAAPVYATVEDLNKLIAEVESLKAEKNKNYNNNKRGQHNNE